MSAGIFAAIAALAISVVGVDVASAAPAAAPTATITPATNITTTSATLNGTVTATKLPTTYHFEYGTDSTYGHSVPNPPQTVPAVNGQNAQPVSASVTGLAPNTTYLFKLVATNTIGTTSVTGTFTTAKPGGTVGNAVTIRATPGTVTYGNATTLSGSVTGSNNASATVTLESTPYPYTAPFKPTGLKATTTTTGGYSFIVKPTVNTHYRVTVKKPSLTSSQTAVRVRVRVGLGVGTLTPRSGQLVRFSGTVTPAHNGKVALIQRRTSTGTWRTVARATLVAVAVPVNGVAISKYSKRLRIFHTGTYRVSVNPSDGDHVTGTSRTRRLRTH